MHSIAVWARICLALIFAPALGSAIGAPTISISSPAKNANFGAPATIAITATVKASTGTTISKVDFYQGATLLGTVTKSPYTYSWSNVAIGNYSLTAKATDSKAAITTSAAVAITVKTNVAPLVSISAPANNASYTAPAALNITATASDSDGTVAKLDFYSGGTLLGTVSSSPYTYAWNGVAAGTYSLTAKATDNSGGTTTSAAIAVTVKTATSTPPTVSISAPANNASYTAPASIPITATAKAATGATLTKVDFFQGATLLGTATKSPYTYTWSAVPAGSYSLTAKATDSKSATATSTATSVTVKTAPPPTVNITAPANATVLDAPATIAISAAASAATGLTISKVDFYNNGSLLGSATTSPYSMTWSSVPAGNYTLTAKATDSAGSATTSGTIAVTVKVPAAPPTVSITSPNQGATYLAPASIAIAASASATASGANITRVDFYDGNTFLGSATSAPFEFNWTNASTGAHSITAMATDSLGTTASATVYVVVDGTDTCTNAPPLTQADKSTMLAALDRLPMSFEANVGQSESSVRFRAQGPGYQLFLTPDTTLLSLRGSKRIGERSGIARGFLASLEPNDTIVHTRFVGGNMNPRVTGLDLVRETSNYIVGNNRANWHPHVPHFAKVKYEEIYPGIDQIFYGAAGKLEYDLILAPGADPREIRLELTGPEKVSLGADGSLLLETVGGTLVQKRPFAYQDIDGRRQPVDADYRLVAKNEVGIWVGQYDTRRPLVIDPVLIYSTYLGGTNGVTEASGIAISRCGEAFVTGYTRATDFPVTGGAIDRSALPGATMGFVTKLNQSGTAVLYSTYFSGSALVAGALPVTNPTAIAVDGTGHAYITGLTTATDLPVTSGSLNATTATGTFVTKLSADGSSLLYSTYLGSAGGARTVAIAVDGAGNAYLTGNTAAADFPVTAGSLRTTNPVNRYSAFVSKLDATGSYLVYSTYLGGVGALLPYGNDTGVGIAVDAAGDAYVAGNTASADFPTTTGAFQPTNPGYASGHTTGFVSKLDPTGATLLYSTYLGSTSTFSVSGIAIDAANNAYVTGTMDNLGSIPASTTFPFKTLTDNLSMSGNTYGFAAKLNPDGATLGYLVKFGGALCNPTTYVCSAGAAQGNAIAVDATGAAWVAGTNVSTGLPLVNPLAWNFAWTDGFVAKINPTGSAFAFSTLLTGQTGPLVQYQRAATGVAVDSVGSAYVTGFTNTTDLPTTAGAFQTSLGTYAGVSAFVAKINETKDTTVSLAVTPNPSIVNLATSLEATVTGVSPTGSITFLDGTFPLGSIAVAGDVAQMTTTKLAGGSHNLSARYSGDAHNNPSTSQTLSLNVSDPTTGPTIHVTGVPDGSVFYTNSGNTYTGATLNITATAAPGNALSAVYLYLPSSTWYWSPGGQTFSTPYGLPAMSPGIYGIHGGVSDTNGNMAYSPLTRFVVNASGLTPPAVTLSSPTSGTTYSAPAQIALMASATPAAGTTIAYISFYQGSTMIASSVANPYSFSWTAVPAGTYSVVAVATDSKGAIAMSAPATITVLAAPPPTVSLSSPTNGALLSPPANILLTANAAGVSGATITQVDFLEGSSVIGTATVPPYALNWPNVPAGNYFLSAKATDSRGRTTLSAPVSVTVGTAASGPPAVEIVSPPKYATFSAPAAIEFSSAAAAFSGVAIAKVEFFDATDQTKLLGTAVVSPYQMTWSNLSPGAYTVVAKATDSTGATSSSDPITVLVSQTQPMSINVTSPVSSAGPIGDDHVSVTGTVVAPPNSAVSVNGVLGTIKPTGAFFVNEVPLSVGANSLKATVTNPDGVTASQTVTVSSTGAAAFRFRATPTSGLVPLTTVLHMSTPANVPFSRIDVSCLDDGIVQYTSTTAIDVLGACEFTSAGSARVRINVWKAQGNGVADLLIYTDAWPVHADSLVGRNALLRGVVATMMNRLKVGDLPGALNSVTSDVYAKFNPVFARIGTAKLPLLVDQLGSITGGSFGDDFAELTIVKNSAAGPKGFPFQLIRGNDGIWRIDGM